MGITGSVPPEQVRRLLRGFRIIDGDLYMDDVDDDDRWVFVRDGYAYYMNTETGEIRERPD